MDIDRVAKLLEIIELCSHHGIRFKAIPNLAMSELMAIEVSIQDKTQQEKARSRAIPAQEVAPLYEAPPPDEPTPTITRRI